MTNQAIRIPTRDEFFAYYAKRESERGGILTETFASLMEDGKFMYISMEMQYTAWVDGYTKGAIENDPNVPFITEDVIKPDLMTKRIRDWG